jgi:hypothetical protein
MISKACEGPGETFGAALRGKRQGNRSPGLKTKSPVTRREMRLAPHYWQSARAFAVHAPKPLAIMLRMTEQT